MINSSHATTRGHDIIRQSTEIAYLHGACSHHVVFLEHRPRSPSILPLEKSKRNRGKREGKSNSKESRAERMVKTNPPFDRRFVPVLHSFRAREVSKAWNTYGRCGQTITLLSLSNVPKVLTEPRRLLKSFKHNPTQYAGCRSVRRSQHDGQHNKSPSYDPWDGVGLRRIRSSKKSVSATNITGWI